MKKKLSQVIQWLTLFFYKNMIYKNTEAQIIKKLRTI